MMSISRLACYCKSRCDTSVSFEFLICWKQILNKELLHTNLPILEHGRMKIDLHFIHSGDDLGL